MRRSLGAKQNGICLSSLARRLRTFHRPPGAESIAFYPWCFLPIRRPHIGNFEQPEVLRVLLSLHPRLSIHDDTIFPLYCRQCHTTMDSEGDHATLSCHRIPCGWETRHEHI
jgi:hypothetical protein